MTEIFRDVRLHITPFSPDRFSKNQFVKARTPFCFQVPVLSGLRCRSILVVACLRVREVRVRGGLGGMCCHERQRITDIVLID